jgi:hypothetical protein
MASETAVKWGRCAATVWLLLGFVARPFDRKPSIGCDRIQFLIARSAADENCTEYEFSLNLCSSLPAEFGRRSFVPMCSQLASTMGDLPRHFHSWAKLRGNDARQ